MVAFVRGESAFMHTDQIFVKLLPSGEAIQLTHDPRPKYGLAFSADGSKIAYTVVSVGMGPAQNVTYAISPLAASRACSSRTPPASPGWMIAISCFPRSGPACTWGSSAPARIAPGTARCIFRTRARDGALLVCGARPPVGAGR